ncbi:maleylpyruvate isomerase family mycothiol-dependent enzyme [Actinomarinicola tropica]|uniref:Maleylpyruvate isomerase family mycothiol-dependent enzyme n=1 Tax=Actinomarinicola tropica TaxID=2789776 RepID=A0A5Q2RNZ6_9ACTN|nr:maleylpyruvate isomerase family mycothiol-dependent enzyme [Actinomarinicola tropica]QGG96672.1 maleylpyruvate isomerase family mycothiol-dependent enzyme [Actinomarinicola tropica]
MSTFDVAAATTENRIRFADAVDALPPELHHAPTLCAGWDVHVLTAHQLQPMAVGFLRFVVASLRHRGDVDATVDALARRLAQRPLPELTAQLRALSHRAVSPPRVGPYGPFADSCIHLRDLARPLGLDVDVPLAHWRAVLDYLVADGAAPTLVPAGRLAGLALRATDQDWSHGGDASGQEVAGPSEALAMATTGRAVALADLAGPGVKLLAGRLGAGAER